MLQHFGRVGLLVLAVTGFPGRAGAMVFEDSFQRIGDSGWSVESGLSGPARFDVGPVADLDPRASAWMEFAGTSFEGADPDALHAGAVDLSASRAAFSLTRSVQPEPRVATLDATVSNIPEPQTWLLVLCGGIFVCMVCKTRANYRASR